MFFRNFLRGLTSFAHVFGAQDHNSANVSVTTNTQATFSESDLRVVLGIGF